MKVILAAAATAALLAGAAIAGNTSTSPTRAQFVALSKRVAVLEKSNAQLSKYVDHCLSTFEAVSRFPAGGATAPGQGYVYDNADGTQVVTDALDLVGPSQTPEFWFVSTPRDCVQASRLYSYQRR